MLYVLPETTGDIIVLQANGTLTQQDYDEIFFPLFDHVRNTHPEVRLLLTFAPDFSGGDEGSVWQADDFAKQHADALYRFAVVSSEQWLSWVESVREQVSQGEVRHYRMTQLLEALRWINDEGEDDEEQELFPFQN